MMALRGLQAQRIPAVVQGQTAKSTILALAGATLQCALQPIVNVHTGVVYGYEALMRGFDQLGFDNPLALLDHAHAIDILPELELLLHQRGVDAFLQAPLAAEAKLFLNIDGRALHRQAAELEGATERLRTRGVSPSAIAIELSETHNLAGDPNLQGLIAKARLQGVRFAMDDFGRGFSELKLLFEQELDYLKIDRFFIHGLADSSKRRLFVANIVNLAHVLGLRVIAEGVETERDYMVCRELGCDLAQGYFIARPTLDPGELSPAYPHAQTAGARSKRGRSTDQNLLQGQIEFVPALREDASVNEVFARFRDNPQNRFFPVVDAHEEPQGIIHERDLKEFVYSPFGRDLLANKAFARTIKSFVIPCPVADIDQPTERIVEIFANSPQSECVIITRGLRYSGLLTTAAMLKIVNEKRLVQAQDQNPLTHLPGNRSILDHVADLIAMPGETRTLCYFDLNNFKAFNDVYGFRQGDRAITLFADSLKRAFPRTDTFLGHIGGDDFFASFRGQPRAILEPALAQFRQRFASDIESFYSAADRERGCIAAKDREGVVRSFPLVQCSIGVLELDASAASDTLDGVISRLSDLKGQAKRNPSGFAWA